MQETALITGAPRRIGRAIATLLAAAGFDVALHTSPRSRDEASALAKDLARTGVNDS